MKPSMTLFHSGLTASPASDGTATGSHNGNCQQDPRTRYPCLATLISPYEKSGEHLVWTALANALIAGSSFTRTGAIGLGA
jgi:hypothetical protein